MRHVGMVSRPAVTALLAITVTACGGPTSARPGEIKDQCRGDSFRVDLADLMDARPAGNPDERVEQLRDWIWPVLLGRLEATTEMRGLLTAVASQPLVRDDALAHVLEQPVGPTRSVTATSGDVVVMVESGAPAAMHEAILEAIDQESLHQAATPPRAVVYRYAIDEGKAYADVCRLDTFDAAWIESRDEGFRRATLRTPGELEAFLYGGVDLVTAQCTANGLEVTGRGRSRVGKAPITVEHVAALYRPRKIDYVPTAKLGVSGDGLRDKFEDWFALAKLAIDHPGALGDRESKLGEEWPTMRDEILAWKKVFPRVETEELLLSWIVQRKDSGFSLDPKIRSRDVVRSTQAMLAALDDPRRMAALLYSWNVEPKTAASFVSRLGDAGDHARVRQGLVAVRDSVTSSSDDEALGIMNRAALSRSNDRELIATAAGLMKQHDGYQCARYDGYLRGTQVGMTMFYTDLLMKLWSDDHYNSAPEDLIPGFESVVGHHLSGAYCTKEERAQPTRAWLGLREEQYARETKERVRFAPVATRVFARSSAYGAGYSEEVEATIENRRFYNWWNARYGRVAEWEPQYELLNQIMKWSVVTQVAALSEHESCVGFLDHIPVDRDHRFDKWVAAGKDLRWRGPMSLVRGQEEPTECLPLLRSRSYAQCDGKLYWVGGVTAAQKAQVATKPVRRLERAQSLGRIDSRSAQPPVVTSDGRVTYDTVAKADGKLKQVTIDPDKRTFTAQIEKTQSQRGAGHSWSAGGEARQVTSVNKSWSLERGKLVGRDKVNGDFGVAHLEAGDVAGAVVKPRITELSVAQVRRMSEAAAARIGDGKTHLADVVADLPGVKKAWKYDADTVLVEISDAAGGPPKYGLMTSSQGIRGPPDSLLGRFGAASPTRGKNAVETVLARETDIRPLLENGRFTPIPDGTVGKLRSQLDDALAAGDTTRSRQLMSELRTRDPMGQKSIQDAITTARRAAARAGKDTRWLDNQQMHASIQLDRPALPVREQTVLPADGTDFYVPSSHATQYSELAALPPGTSPVTGPGTARSSFHARIMEEAPAPGRLSQVIQVNGTEWVHVKRPDAGRPVTLPRIYIVYPCETSEDDSSDTSVPCHGRSAARQDEQSYRQDLLRKACSLGDEQARALGVNDCGALRRKP
jgi:hypothetical protein